MNNDVETDPTATADPTGRIRTHAASVASAILNALRNAKPPDFKEVVCNLRDPNGVQTKLQHSNPRTVVIRNFSPVTVYVWDGSGAGLPWLTCGSNRFIVFPAQPGVRELTIGIAPSGTPPTTGGPAFVAMTDQKMTAAEGPLAT